MNRFRNTLIAAASLSLLAANLMLITTRNSHAGGTPPAPIPVTVSNSSLNIRDIDNGALQPVTISLSPNSASSTSATDSFTVPAGKRLVIEFVSASNTQYNAGGAATEYLITTVGGNQAYFRIVNTVASTATVNMPVKIYADPGTQVSALEQQLGGSSCGGIMNISGHYVNVP